MYLFVLIIINLNSIYVTCDNQFVEILTIIKNIKYYNIILINYKYSKNI